MTAAVNRLAIPAPVLGVLIVASAATMFGMLGPVSRFSYALGLAPFSFIFWRSILGMAGTGGAMAFRWRRAAPAGADWRAGRARMAPRNRVALLAAGTGGFLVNIGMFVAFQRLPIALVLLTFYTYPALVALASVALGRERLDRHRATALLLASAGAAVVVLNGPAPADGGATTPGIDGLGLGLAFMAALGQTMYVLVSRGGYDMLAADEALTFVLGFIAAAGAVVAVLLGAGANLALPLARADLLLLLVFGGLFTAAVPSSLMLVGIRRLGGMRTGILMLIEPLVGVLLAALLLAEPVVPLQLVGGLAILGAAVMLSRASLSEDDAVAAAVP